MSDDTVYTTHGGDNPYLVTDTYITVFAAVSFERQVFLRDIEVYADRIVGVIQQSGKVCLYLGFIDPASLFHGSHGMADGVTILDDILALGEIFQCHLMAGRHVFLQRDGMTVYRDGLACF